MIANRIAGAVLIAIGLFGFPTVDDDSRHVGEIVGVSAVVLAGNILMRQQRRLSGFLPLWLGVVRLASFPV
jgi:hypothetical protein